MNDVLLLHQLIRPRHELVVHMLGVITDVLGVLRLMGTGAVRVVADQVQEAFPAGRTEITIKAVTVSDGGYPALPDS